MEYLFIYLLQVANSISFLSAFCLAIGLVFGLGFGGMYIISEERGAKKPFKISVIILLIGGLLTLVPNKQTLITMGGIYGGKQVIHSQISQKAYNVINLQLDNLIENLKEEINKH